MEAIIEEKVEFVAMILQQTVVMKDFLQEKGYKHFTKRSVKDI